jgi:phenylacetic acid degradation operon negative regulatory protein
MGDSQVSPVTFVFSLFAQYALPRGGEVWIGTLIQALATLGFNDGAMRTLISRMQANGFLQSRRIGRNSFYQLTDSGLKEVHGGGKRTFARDEAWDGQWTVVVYSIPEDHRERRNALRDLLIRLGFGAITPGTWLSPHALPEDMEEEWRRLGVHKYLEVFRADHIGPSDPAVLVAHAWPQLPEIAERYRSYVATYEAIERRLQEAELSGEQCFAAQLRSLIDFVAINLKDPRLPGVLLPDDWPRSSAYQLFKTLQHMLVAPAEKYFDTIYHPE